MFLTFLSFTISDFPDIPKPVFLPNLSDILFDPNILGL